MAAKQKSVSGTKNQQRSTPVGPSHLRRIRAMLAAQMEELEQLASQMESESIGELMSKYYGGATRGIAELMNFTSDLRNKTRTGSVERVRQIISGEISSSDLGPL